MVLHHAGQKGNKVRILPRLAAHSTCEATLGVSGLALTQTVEDVHTLGVCGAGGELQETMGHDTEDPLASHSRHQTRGKKQRLTLQSKFIQYYENRSEILS